ncbi:discoidin domain-containing protein [Paenibacillus montanisoli]|uniref:F5/8 type C domain-containing protein n=1 Tax=Paenibacillus montanisoli TaxID=2081970 RepID=A0A328U561_9BACL|nr:discoidin domain-containing protein [Paenibacillus montanisoli]RAP75164.1 hypothetical protein DL346_17430 [Paenibacillus montanisoli]
MNKMKTFKPLIGLMIVVMMMTMMASVAFAADGIKYKVAAFSSQNKDYPASNLEGDGSNFWHTEWEEPMPKPPHWVVLDLQGEFTVSELKYLPRQDNDNPNGHITEYNVYVSMDNKTFDKVASGTWDKSSNKVEESASFDPVKAKYVKLESVKDDFLAAQKITIIGTKAAADSVANDSGAEADTAASNPKTGDMGTLPYIVLALAAATAFVATKKIRFGNK